MSTDAPHGTASEYSTCRAESISGIAVVKASLSNHVIATVMLGKSLYEFVALIKPCGMSSELINIIVVLVCWKRVFSGKLTHKCWCTFFAVSKEYQYCLVIVISSKIDV